MMLADALTLTTCAVATRVGHDHAQAPGCLELFSYADLQQAVTGSPHSDQKKQNPES